MQQKATAASVVRGSELTDRGRSECAKVTEWLEVTPLELKLAIESRIDNPNEQLDYDKENECPLCLCPLYDHLQDKTIEEMIDRQKQIFAAKIKKAATN